MAKKTTKEKEKPVAMGNRIYKKHRKMLKSIARSMKLASAAEANRVSIELTYAGLAYRAGSR